MSVVEAGLAQWQRCEGCRGLWLTRVGFKIWCNVCQTGDRLRPITDAEMAVIHLAGYDVAQGMP